MRRRHRPRRCTGGTGTGVAFRACPRIAWSLSTIGAICVISGCATDILDGVPPASDEHAAATVRAWFTDAAAAAGLDFVHDTGARGGFYFPEIMGSGVALLDYDNDGDLDVYLVQSGTMDPHAADDPHGRSPTAARGGQLFRNDLPVDPEDATPRLRFTNVTEESGLETRGYGMGVAVGDVTNDGCVDLYLTHVGPNQLFRNDCDGTFTDVSDHSATDDAGWGVSAAFLDYDADGWLDLYVGNYVHYHVETNVRCPSLTGGLDYCPPRTYRAQPDRLFRNVGEGRFVDATATALTGRAFGPALGVSAADLNNDGRVDVYVANDGTENQLWINAGDGTFENLAVWSGAAVNADGRSEASMGVDAGDVDGDGDEDLFMTHLLGETNTLYINNGGGIFEDRTLRTGLGAGSLGFTGFGTAMIDADNDGWLDVVAVNGTVEASSPSPEGSGYAQPNQLFRNMGGGRFEDVTLGTVDALTISDISRGVAAGDIDNDGDMDVVVTNNGGPARLLINQVGHRNHWVGLTLQGRQAPRPMLGARVAVIGTDGRTRWRRVRTDGSYASAHDSRVLVGMGTATDPPRVRVVWPDGRTEEWPEVPLDRWTTLREGDGG